jgi:hypothetical protein
VLSEQTKQSIEQAFHRALRATLTRAPDDVCAIVPATGPGRGGQPGETLLVVTISSFVFRLLTLFQVGGDPATRAYYVSSAQQSLDEAFREFANMCCGALNRELSEQIPHLAMSIPYTLSSQCMAYLGELQPHFLSSSAVTINDSVQLQVTLCMCCSAAVDFVASAPVAEPAAGELEMF